MPKRKFEESSSESSASLPRENFIASNIKDNKKHEIPLRRIKKPLSSESDSENEEQQLKDSDQQGASNSHNRQKMQSIKQPKNISHEVQMQLDNRNVDEGVKIKKKRQNNNKKARIEIEGDIDEQNERASSSNSVNAHHLNALPKPKELYNFFKFIVDLSKDGKLNLTGKKGNVKFEALLRDQPNLDTTIDLGVMQSALTTVYRWATAQSETPLVDALNRAMEYLQSEQILYKYNDHPKIHNTWNIYLKNHGKNPFNAGEKLKQKFKNKEDAGVKLAEEEYLKNTGTYIAQLHEYIDRHQDQLFDSQIEYLQKNIKKLEKGTGKQKLEKGTGKQKQKEENGNEKAKGPKRARRKIAKTEEKRTPFELFKMTMIEKYTDLPEEQRNAKLLKKFNKLDETAKGVYENIANHI